MASSNPVDAWSYSRLTCYEQCPALFKYRNIDKLPEPKAPAMQRGIDIHRECERFLKGEGPVTEHMRRFHDQFEELAAYFEPIVEQKWGYTRDWKATGFFTKTPPDMRPWLRVIPDAVVLYEDGTADVIDFKTGKPYGEYSDQMSLFADAIFHRHHDIQRVTARLWFLDTGAEVVEEFARRGLAERKAKWEARVEPLFNDTQFPARPNSKCKWCHFSSANNGPCQY